MKIALATTDKLRVVALETLAAALMDFINTKIDFDERSYIKKKILEHTPAE